MNKTSKFRSYLGGQFLTSPQSLRSFYMLVDPGKEAEPDPILKRYCLKDLSLQILMMARIAPRESVFITSLKGRVPHFKNYPEGNAKIRAREGPET